MAKENLASPMLKHYDAGNVRAARQEARQLLVSPTASEADRSAARDILERTRLPRVAVLLVGAAVALISLMILLAVLRSGK